MKPTSAKVEMEMLFSQISSINWVAKTGFKTLVFKDTIIHKIKELKKLLKAKRPSKS